MSRDYKYLAFKNSIPIFFGYVAIGIPFGMIVTGCGYAWWVALLMSLVIFSGTAEYLGIAMFAAGLPLPTILSVQLFIGLRHAFYGISLLEKYKGTGKFKPFLIFLLSDETFAITSTVKVPDEKIKGKFYFLISFLNYSYWNLGSVLGALIGKMIPQQHLEGVDFALTALFAVLMVNQIKSSKDFVPSAVGIVTSVVAISLSYISLNGHRILPSQHVILVGLSLGIAVIIFLRGIRQKKSVSEV